MDSVQYQLENWEPNAESQEIWENASCRKEDENGETLSEEEKSYSSESGLGIDSPSEPGVHSR